MFTKLAKKIILPIVTVGVMVTSGITTANAALGDQVLGIKMKHSDIKILQEELKELGHFNNEDTTTYYGVYTEEAVKSFQKSQGLEQNGKYDAETHKALEKAKADKIKNLQDSNKILTYKQPLKLASKGPDVKLVQEKLKELGYLKIDNCTDYYGHMTVDAMKLFQETYGLKADGVTDARTVDTINNLLLGRTPKKEVPNRSASRKPAANSKGSSIVQTAKGQIGKSYVFGATGPNAFDCSGFTSYVYRQAGYSLPRSSSGQAGVGTKVSKANLQPGDLLIFSNTYKSGPSHVGVYIGNGQFVHSATPRRGVTTDSINSRYYAGKFSYGRRLY